MTAFIAPRSVVANFDTDPPDPSLVSIAVGTVTTTYAEIRMAVENPQSGTRMSLRYRETTPNAPWSTTLTSGAGRPDWYLRFNFLSADTEYKAQLSIDPSFPTAETLSTTFTSLLANPSLEHLERHRSRHHPDRGAGNCYYRRPQRHGDGLHAPSGAAIRVVGQQPDGNHHHLDGGLYAFKPDHRRAVSNTGFPRRLRFQITTR